METADIQRRWLTYFGDRGHTVVPSASLVSDDPTLMVARKRDPGPLFPWARVLAKVPLQPVG